MSYNGSGHRGLGRTPNRPPSDTERLRRAFVRLGIASHNSPGQMENLITQLSKSFNEVCVLHRLKPTEFPVFHVEKNPRRRAQRQHLKDWL